MRTQFRGLHSLDTELLDVIALNDTEREALAHRQHFISVLCRLCNTANARPFGRTLRLIADLNTVVVHVGNAIPRYANPPKGR
jgi:hypothetical protein